MTTTQKGAAWLLALLEPDGSLRGATALDSYYKAPCALWFSGHRAEAERVFDFAAARFLQPDGDLDGTGVGWYDKFRIYPHAWLAWAAVEIGRPELAGKLIGFLLTRRNRESGGFRADASGEGTATEEIMTTSVAGLACLCGGEIDAALGVAAWLQRVFESQPNLTRQLIHVWKQGSGLTEGDRSVWYIVDCTKPRQWYFQYGISAAFLAELSRATGDRQWLELARQYLHASKHCREDVYQTPQSGKIGWGAGWTYRMSRQPEDRVLVETVSQGLAALQCGDGSWNGEGVYEAKPSSDSVARIDVTSEFVALLSLMEESVAV